MKHTVLLHGGRKPARLGDPGLPRGLFQGHLLFGKRIYRLLPMVFMPVGYCSMVPVT